MIRAERIGKASCQSHATQFPNSSCWQISTKFCQGKINIIISIYKNVVVRKSKQLPQRFLEKTWLTMQDRVYLSIKNIITEWKASKHSSWVFLPKKPTAGSDIAVTLVLIHADVLNEWDDVNHVGLQQSHVSCMAQKKKNPVHLSLTIMMYW